MKQIRIILLLIAASMLLYACPDKEEGHRYITFVNKSGNDICTHPEWFIHNNGEDTLYRCNSIPLHINANTSHNFESAIRSSSWEKEFSSGTHYLRFLIMDIKTYKRYMKEPCDTIRKYVPILHTYRLTLEDLQRMNWTVTFPPIEP
jgi:hypothetical protein